MRKKYEADSAAKGVSDPYARHNARTDVKGKKEKRPSSRSKSPKSGKGKSKGAGSSGRPGICVEFQKSGTCRYGDACKFSHER